MSEAKDNKNNAQNPTDADVNAEAEKILADARAEADKLLADAEKQAKKTAAAAKEKAEGIIAAAETGAKATEAGGFRPAGVPDPAGEELVEYTAPLLGPEKGQDVLVGVNGKIIRIQRGQTVKLQRKYVEVLRHAQEQEYAAYQAMEEAKKQSAAAAMNL